jgi:hypothetical protein
MDEHEFQELMRYQALLSRQVVQEAKTDRKIKLLEIISQLGAGRKKIQTAALLHEAEHRGMLESEIYDIIDELLRDGMLADAGEGFVKRT